MSRKGNCYDNCIMETFFGRLKNEMYYGYEKDYSSFKEFSKAIEEYIDYYCAYLSVNVPELLFS